MRRKIINRANPRLTIQMDWGHERPAGAIALYVARAGDPQEFAVYSPLSENGGELMFQFDELLFMRPQGRFIGRLVVGVTDIALINMDYVDPIRVLSVENSSRV